MTFIEKYLKNRLGRAEAPPTVDADDLWADIEQRLPGTSPTPSGTVSLWRSGGWLTVAILLLVAGFWRFSSERMTADDTPPATEATDDRPTQPLAGELVRSPRTEADGQPTQQVGNASAALVEAFGNTPPASDLDNTHRSGPIVNAKEVVVPAAAATPDQRATTPVPLLPSTDQDHQGPSHPLAPAPLRPRILPESAPQKEAALRGQQDLDAPSRNEPGVSPLPRLALSAPTPPSATEPFTGIGPQAPAALPFRSATGSRFSLGVYAGSNLLGRHYLETPDGTALALNNATGTAAGTSAGVSLNYRFKPGIIVGAGLEYHRTLNPFDHRSEMDTSVVHPSAFNSGLINATVRRRTTHNHRLRFLTIPLTLSHCWRLGSFDLGLGVGLGLNLLQSATGKTLTNDERVVTYDRASGSADIPDFFLSYRLQPAIAWQPTAKSPLSLELRTNLSYQSFGSSALSGTKQRGMLLSAGLGLRYGF